MSSTESFIDEPARINSIRGRNTIYSAAGEGRVAWVSADDVAAVAVRALTNKQPPNTEYMLLGPELLSYFLLTPPPPRKKQPR